MEEESKKKRGLIIIVDVVLTPVYVYWALERLCWEHEVELVSDLETPLNRIVNLLTKTGLCKEKSRVSTPRPRDITRTHVVLVKREGNKLF